jgi:hypothetical protein
MDTAPEIFGDFIMAVALGYAVICANILRIQSADYHPFKAGVTVKGIFPPEFHAGNGCNHYGAGE